MYVCPSISLKLPMVNIFTRITLWYSANIAIPPSRLLLNSAVVRPLIPEDVMWSSIYYSIHTNGLSSLHWATFMQFFSSTYLNLYTWSHTAWLHAFFTVDKRNIRCIGRKCILYFSQPLGSSEWLYIMLTVTDKYSRHDQWHSWPQWTWSRYRRGCANT